MRQPPVRTAPSIALLPLFPAGGAALTPQEVPRPALRKEVRLPALFPPRGLYSPEGALPNQKVRP